MITVELRVAPIACVSANICLSPATMHEKGVQILGHLFLIYKNLAMAIFPPSLIGLRNYAVMALSFFKRANITMALIKQRPMRMAQL